MNKIFYSALIVVALTTTYCNGMWGNSKNKNPVAEGLEKVSQGLNEAAAEVRYRSREFDEAASIGNEDGMLNAVTFGWYNYLLGPRPVQREKEFTSHLRHKNNRSSNREKKSVDALLAKTILSGTSFCGCLCATLYGLSNLFHKDSSKLAAFLSCTIGTAGMLASVCSISQDEFAMLRRYVSSKKR